MNYKYETMINDFNAIAEKCDENILKAISVIYNGRLKKSYNFIQYLISSEFGHTTYNSSVPHEVQQALSPCFKTFDSFSEKYRKFSGSWGKDADNYYYFNGMRLVLKPDALPIFEDKYYTKETRKLNGVYLIGQTTFNPHTNEKFFWLKVGGTSNLKNRMGSYDTDNPAYFKIDFLDCGNNPYPKFEVKYREKLARKAICSSNRNSEWFLVDELTYLVICKEGFKYFD